MAWQLFPQLDWELMATNHGGCGGEWLTSDRASKVNLSLLLLCSLQISSVNEGLVIFLSPFSKKTFSSSSFLHILSSRSEVETCRMLLVNLKVRLMKGDVKFTLKVSYVAATNEALC